MAIDVDAARQDTRGTAHATHLDSAGSSLMPRPVADAVVAHLRREELVGGYAAAAEAAERLEAVYSSLARLIGSSPGEIAVLESGSTAWAAAVSRLRPAAPRVLLGRTEYWHNVLVLRRLARRDGLELVVLDDDAHGQVDVAHLRRELDRGDVGMVALTHVPMGGAQVQPAAEVGRACRAAGVPFVLDACQSAGQLPLDVQELGCDVLVGTGRKFLRGPRGTAFVHVRRELLDRLEPELSERRSPARDAGEGRARLLESWETGVAARLGLGRAVDHALELGPEPIRDRVRALAESLRGRLAALPAVQVHDRGLVRCGIVTFSVRDRPPDRVQAHLAGQRITVSTAPLPPPAAEQVLDPAPEHQTVAVRASVHYYNTEEELDRLAAALS
ncbi:aminotransferase class V-fold PLP-dependent enzyme [Kocuria sp. CPCC 205292]|uniref:aminotransferase class V-fold PLP-dependent enzyme n=1 Tax=Kocuria cellulosilytica TaxID=3071451 RepID=UPI0034D625CD